MGVESAADRAVFLSDDEFGVTATYAPAAGGAFDIAGNFDHAARPALNDPGFIGAPPQFVCRTADIPAGAATGDALTIDGTTYAVRALIPDGTGMSNLILEETG